MNRSISIYLEIGTKRAFAAALDWPGWCRSGRTSEAAITALSVYQPRYAAVLAATSIPFQADHSPFVVAEQLPGSASTDFGAPGAIPPADVQPIDAAERARLQAILAACWAAFAQATTNAAETPLRSGARGGGRTMDKLAAHVLEGDASYLARLQWKHKVNSAEPLPVAIERIQQAQRDALAAAAHGLPQRGPRGGVLWPPRYFVRRSAWHILDHVWEIEDRLGT